MTSQWWVYLLQCSDNSIYCGITTDVMRRESEHNAGNTRYTRSRRPVSLVYSESAVDRSAASKREHHIKKQSHTWKMNLAGLSQ